jgi:hypothetical protein
MPGSDPATISSVSGILRQSVGAAASKKVMHFYVSKNAAICERGVSDTDDAARKADVPESKAGAAGEK